MSHFVCSRQIFRKPKDHLALKLCQLLKEPTSLLLTFVLWVWQFHNAAIPLLLQLDLFATEQIYIGFRVNSSQN